MTLPEPDLAHVLEHTQAWEKLEGKRIFVSGASGFVGRWLTESFAWVNDALRLNSELVVLKRDALPNGDFDFGIHLARAEGVSADMVVMRRVLDFAKERSVKRFLYTSSGAVYGRLADGATQFLEDQHCAPETEYGQAKLAGEHLCSGYPFCSVIARLFAFSGPALPLDLNFAIGNFVRDALEGGPLRIKGDGSAKRSYLYAADLAIWLWTMLLEGEGERPYNVGSPVAVSIADLARAVVANTRSEMGVVIEGGAGGGIYVPSIERANAELKLRPLVGLAEGIRRMYAWNLSAKDREMALAPATTP